MLLMSYRLSRPALTHPHFVSTSPGDLLQPLSSYRVDTCMVILLSKKVYSMSHECILHITDTTVFHSFKEQIIHFISRCTIKICTHFPHYQKNAIPCFHSTVGLCTNKPFYCMLKSRTYQLPALQ